MKNTNNMFMNKRKKKQNSIAYLTLSKKVLCRIPHCAANALMLCRYVKRLHSIAPSGRRHASLVCACKCLIYRTQILYWESCLICVGIVWSTLVLVFQFSDIYPLNFDIVYCDDKFC